MQSWEIYYETPAARQEMLYTALAAEATNDEGSAMMELNAINAKHRLKYFNNEKGFGGLSVINETTKQLNSH